MERKVQIIFFLGFYMGWMRFFMISALTCSFFLFGLLLFREKKEQAMYEYIKYV